MKNHYLFKISLLVALLFGLNIAKAANIYVSGTISSSTTWTADTVKVNSDIIINDGITLTIPAGTYVEMLGHYKIDVKGRILAEGTKTNKIVFTAKNQSAGWSGIRYYNTPSTNDTSRFTHCIISYAKANVGGIYDKIGGAFLFYKFAKAVIKNCYISNNYATYYGGGIALRYYSHIKLINNVIVNNSASSRGGGVYIYRSDPKIINNTIANNQSSSSGGIYVSYFNGEIRNSIVYGNSANSYSQINGSYNSISNCDFEGGYQYGSKNYDTIPYFVNPTSGAGNMYNGLTADYSLSSNSYLIDKGVNSFAINNDGDNFDIAGNFRYDGRIIDIGAYEYIASTELCGYINSNTTLSGNVLVNCDVSVSNGVTLTIEPGTDIIFTGFHYLNISGRLLAQGTKDNFINITSWNKDEGWQGIRFYYVNTSNDSSKIEYCKITNKVYNGSGDTHGAIYVNHTDELLIRNNIIANNKGRYGGGLSIYNSSIKVIGNLIGHNETDISGYGAGIRIQTSNSQIINNTIVANKNINSSNKAAGVYIDGTSNVILKNNIIYNNSDNTNSHTSSINITSMSNVTYSCVEGGNTNDGNITTSPLFKNPTSVIGRTNSIFDYNYALQENSLCIDAGDATTTGLNLPEFDLAGKTRNFSTGIDIGAYEDKSTLTLSCSGGNTVISADETWDANTIKIDCDVEIQDGATVTIIPGVKIEFQDHYHIYVKGAIQAKGTEQDSILFVAKTNSTGWDGILLDDPNEFVNDSNIFDYCRFQYAKRSPSTYLLSGSAISTNNSRELRITNSHFLHNSLTGGVQRGNAVSIYYYHGDYDNHKICNNLFEYNTGGSHTLYFQHSNVRVNNNIFYKNTVTSSVLEINYAGGYFENNLFANNNVADGAIKVENAYDNYFPRIYNNIIVNNEGVKAGGIYVKSIKPEIYNNTIVNNYSSNALYTGGLYFDDNADANLKSNIIYGNRSNGGATVQIYLESTTSDPKFYNNDIEGGELGLAGTGSGINFSGVFSGNINASPSFTAESGGVGTSFDGKAADWSLAQGSSLINVGFSNSSSLEISNTDFVGNDRIYNGRIDIGAYENQDNIIAPCTISDDTEWEADTIRIGCDVTINTTKTLTIKEGTVILFTGFYGINVEGRIIAEGTNTDKITFVINDTTGFYDIETTAGGWSGINFDGVVVVNDSSKFSNCIFKYGLAPKKSGVLTYSDQYGGAMYIYNSPKISIQNCLFTNNRAFSDGGALYVESSDIEFKNNIIVNNTANSYGGGFYGDDFNSEYLNNTVAYNAAKYYGGAYFRDSEMKLINSVFWGNRATYYADGSTGASNGYISQLGFYTSNNSEIYNNDIQFGKNRIGGGYQISTYVDNIDNDPQFISPSDGYGYKHNGSQANWNIASLSPVLNAGKISNNNASTDFLGNTRVIADTVDMGAYEIQLSSRFIDVQPENKSVCIGLPLSLSAHATVSANYQWQLNGTSIPGATNNIYLKPTLSILDTGNYSCIISNENGSIGTDTIEVVGQTMPVVTSSPISTEGCIGTSVTFTGTAEGTEPLTYSWYSTNGALGTGTSNSYTIASITANDASTYRLNISNMCGAAFTNGATFTVKTAPTLTDISATGNICENGANTYTTSATGTTPITYQWYKAGVAIPSATSVSYSISNAPTSAAGTYYCIATNDCGTDQTNQSVLTVNELPSISVQPISKTVCENQSYTFSVTASGAAPLTYQWYKGGVSINNANNNTYTMSSIASSDDGTTYYCVVSNSCSSATSTTATLTVQSSPSISSQTSSIDVCAGSAAPFSITATGIPAPTYQWYNGSGSISSATNDAYTIASSTTSNAGNYYCVATNTCGSATSNNIPLTVNSAPSITSQPSDLTKCEDQSALFDLQADGTAQLTYQWYKGASPISGATNLSYLISPVGTSDAANYKCIVTNTCGNATSDIVSLTVNTNVNITSQSNSQTLCEGTSPTLSVTATGTTGITYQWYDDDGAITGEVANSLNFASLDTSDEGNYYCIATNICATATSSSIALNVNENPTIATNPSSSVVCENLSTVFNVSTNGTPPFTYQWSDDNGEIVGATNSSYLIPQVATTDAGNYTVKVSNTCGDITSSAAALTVKTNVSITNQSTSSTVCNGASPSFSVTASGTNPITYQWFKNNDTIVNNATSSIYNIASAASSDDADYFVIVSNTCNTAQSNMISLTVNESPSISTQPADATVCSGSSVQFNAAATGTSPMTYQWYDANGAISGATSSNYLISQTSTSDAGSYYAIVTNSCDNATTNNAALTVNNPVVVTSQPTNIGICENNTASMSVTVTGTSPISYQWFSGVDTLVGATNNTYSINNADTSNAGSYFVMAMNMCNTIQSNSLILSVSENPSITSQPIDAVVCSGSSAQFSTTAIGTAPLSYQWYNANGIIVGANNVSYLVSQSNSSDAGNYYVKVSNSCSDETSNNALLTVNEPVAITSQPASVNVCNNSSASLSMTVSGTNPITYQWYHSSDSLIGATNTSYTINNTDSADEGNYYAIASNLCNSIQSYTVSLNIDASPSIISQPSNTTVCSGSSSLFSIGADGTSPLTYQWYDANGLITGANNTNYIISQSTSNDAGAYYVKISNSCGYATSNNAVLTVIEPLAITTQPTDVAICENSAAAMSLTVSGTAPITYQWFLNNDSISTATNNAYSINNVDTSYEGSYFAIAKNSCGSVQSNNIELSISIAPSIVTQTSGASKCVGGSFSFNVNVDGTAPFNYQWNKDTATIAGANSALYMINTLDTSDAASYYCNISNACGSVQSTNKVLIVNSYPSIISQSGSLTKCEGDPAYFTVSAIGSNPLLYQWYGDTGAVVGVNTNSFTIANTNISNAGTYYVTIGNNCGSITSSTKTLTINTAPVLLSQSNDDTLCEGLNEVFQVGVSGTNPISYQWYKDNSLLPSAISSYLGISSVDTNDIGDYHAIATNLCSSVQSSDIHLHVNQLANIISQSGDSSRCEGETMTFNVVATGTSPLQYQWYKGSIAISGANSNIYPLSNLSLSDAGFYHLDISNICNSTSSNYKNLSVNANPVVELGNDTSFCDGGVLQLSAGYGYQAQWNTGSYNNQINVTSTGSYFVNVADQYGCQGVSDTINVNVVLPYANQELCMVGIDTATNMNTMVWEKTPNQGIESFNVYKESAVSNVWNLIGNVPYDSLSVFTDLSSTPTIKPERYSISVIDSCGNESSRSLPHRTMHLTVNQGQTANDWNLIWNAYEGFQAATYRIYRADSTMNFIKLDSIAGSSSYTYLYTDYSAPSGALYYMIEIVHPNGGCNPTKANTNYNTSRSNTANNGLAMSTALVPDFIADVTHGNAPMIVHFYDQTTNGDIDSWFWNFGDGGSSASENPIHQYDSAGVYHVALTVTNQFGAQSKVKANFIDVLPNGIVNIHSDFDIKVFPNPYKGKTNIAYALINQTDVKIEVYSSLGELVTVIVDGKQTAGSYKFQFSASDYGYAQGVYYLRMTLDDEVITKRLVEVK